MTKKMGSMNREQYETIEKRIRVAGCELPTYSRLEGNYEEALKNAFNYNEIEANILEYAGVQTMLKLDAIEFYTERVGLSHDEDVVIFAEATFIVEDEEEITVQHIIHGTMINKDERISFNGEINLDRSNGYYFKMEESPSLALMDIEDDALNKYIYKVFSEDVIFDTLKQFYEELMVTYTVYEEVLLANTLKEGFVAKVSPIKTSSGLWVEIVDTANGESINHYQIAAEDISFADFMRKIRSLTTEEV